MLLYITESTQVQLPMLPSTVESSEETSIPATKKKPTGTGRRGTHKKNENKYTHYMHSQQIGLIFIMCLSLFQPAKLQVKPRTTRTKQASKTLAAKEAELSTIQDSEVPGSSAQPEAFDVKAAEEVNNEPQEGSSDHVDAEEETGGKTSEGSSSGAQARGVNSRTR